MSISIHYKGRIDDKRQVRALMDEIQDIAETMGWNYHCLDEDWKKKSQLKLEHRENGTYITGHAGLKGISFSPHPESETIWLFFDHEGWINSPMNLVTKDDYTDLETARWLSVKTQMAGAETHIAILKLFKYLKKKYISNLEISDDGGYWESNDQEALEEKFAQLNMAIDMITSALTNLPINSEDDTKSIVRKIEDLLRGLGFERSPDDGF